MYMCSYIVHVWRTCISQSYIPCWILLFELKLVYAFLGEKHGFCLPFLLYFWAIASSFKFITQRMWGYIYDWSLSVDTVWCWQLSFTSKSSVYHHSVLLHYSDGISVVHLALQCMTIFSVQLGHLSLFLHFYWLYKPYMYFWLFWNITQASSFSDCLIFDVSHWRMYLYGWIP